MSPQQRCSGLLRWLSGKESVCQCRRCKRFRFDPWVWKIPWRRKWEPIPASLPGKSHGQRNLVGYNTSGSKESSWLSKHTAEIFKTCEYVTIYNKEDFGDMIKGKHFEVGDCCFRCSVAKPCLTLCDPMNCSTPGFPVLHYLLEFAQYHGHWTNNANHLTLCHPLLLPSVFPSTKVFFNESALCIRWPKYWSFNISPSNEYPGLISFRIDWFDLLLPRDSQKSSPVPQFESINSLILRLLYGPALTPIHD